MNFCPNCGTKLETGAQFCSACGQATRKQPAFTSNFLALAACVALLLGVAGFGVLRNQKQETPQTREYGTAAAQFRGEQLQRIEFGQPDPDCSYQEKGGKIESVRLAGRIVQSMTIRFDDGFAEQIDMDGLELPNSDQHTINAAAREGRVVRAGISYCGNGGIPEYNWIEFR